MYGERLEELRGGDAGLKKRACVRGCIREPGRRERAHLLEGVDPELDVVREDLLAACARAPWKSAQARIAGRGGHGRTPGHERLAVARQRLLVPREVLDDCGVLVDVRRREQREPLGLVRLRRAHRQVDERARRRVGRRAVPDPAQRVPVRRAAPGRELGRVRLDGADVAERAVEDAAVVDEVDGEGRRARGVVREEVDEGRDEEGGLRAREGASASRSPAPPVYRSGEIRDAHQAALASAAGPRAAGCACSGARGAGGSRRRGCRRPSRRRCRCAARGCRARRRGSGSRRGSGAAASGRCAPGRELCAKGVSAARARLLQQRGDRSSRRKRKRKASAQ